MKTHVNSILWILKKRILPWTPLALFLAGTYGIYLLVSSSSSPTGDSAEIPDPSSAPLANNDSSPAAAEATEPLPVIPLAERESVYHEALERAKNPSGLKRARELMRQLAPISGDLEDGHADAHLWVAKDLLSPGAASSPLNRAETDAPLSLTAAELDQIGEHLRRATKLNPDHLEAHEFLAIYYLRTGDGSKAVSLLEKAVDRLPNLGLMLATIHQRSGNTVEAKARAQAAALHFKELALTAPDDPALRLHWAKAEMLQNNTEAALAIIERGETMHRDFPQFHELRLQVHLQQCQVALGLDPPDYDAAFAELETLLSLDRDHLKVVQQIGDLTDVPETADRATAMLRSLSQSKNTPALTFKFLGDLAAKEAQMTEAISHYEAALTRQPEFPAVKNNFAWCLSRLDPPQLDRALRIINEAIEERKKSSPNTLNPLHLETRGQILIKLERYQEAIADLEQALRYMAKDTRREVHASLALAYEALGNARLAETHQRLAEESDPS